jgi:hypothetical protein
MTYVIIYPDGRAEQRPGIPSLASPDNRPESLARLIAAQGQETGPIDLIRSSFANIAAWANDEFLTHAQAGRMQRNVIGSVVLGLVGATEQAYAGPLVFTGLYYHPIEGYLPAGLEPSAELALMTAVDDVTFVLTGTGRPSAALEQWAEGEIKRLAEVARRDWDSFAADALRIMSLDDWLGHQTGGRPGPQA